MSPFRLRSILLLAGLLLALSAYLALHAFGGGGEPALVYPGEGDEVVRPPAHAAPLGAGDALPEVLLEITPVARILELPAAPRVRVRRARDGDGAVPARVEWLAGSGAGPLGRGRPGDPQLVRVELGDGAPLYRVVSWPAGQEEVELVLEGPLTCAGRVLDGAGRPVPGARVWLAGRPEVRTDAEGRFEVAGLRGRHGLPLVVRAEGRADHFRVVSAGVAPADLVLHEEAELTVRVAAAAPEDGALSIYLRPRGGAGESSTGLQHYPFFWPLVAGPAARDPDGSWRLRGLPRGESVEVVAHHPRLAVRPAPVHLRSARQALVLQGEGGPAVEGRVVAPDGAPVAGALVVCPPRRGALLAPAGTGLLLPPSARLAPLAHAFTAADGSFAVAREAGRDRQRVAVLPAGPIGLEWEIRQGGEVRGARFELVAPGPAGPRPALRLLPGRAMRLVVLRGGSRDPAVVLAEGSPYLLELREPAVLEVTVRGAGAPRRLAVRGVVDLAL